MVKKQKFLTLHQWDRFARVGMVTEPQCTDATYPNGILCPHIVHANGNHCGQMLFDLPFEFNQHGVKKRAIGCNSCNWWGSREIAKDQILSKHVEKITVEKWNELRKLHFEMSKGRHDRKFLIVCPKCNEPVQDQEHSDTSDHPFKIQVVCSNLDCNYHGYRLE